MMTTISQLGMMAAKSFTRSSARLSSTHIAAVGRMMVAQNRHQSSTADRGRTPEDYYSWHTLEFKETPHILELPEPPRPYGQLVCNIVLSGYMPDHLDFMAYFSRYTAKSMNMSVSETIHMKTYTQRWFTNKGPFVHAKTKEIFERKQYYRMVQVFDAHPESVKEWVQYVNKSLPAGIDLKVERWEWEPVGFGQSIPEPNLKGKKTHAEQIQEQASKYIKQFSK